MNSSDVIEYATAGTISFYILLEYTTFYKKNCFALCMAAPDPGCDGCLGAFILL